jgi:WD40 repeat protein
MWRFVGFVLLVIAGLAAVFYYKGQADDTMKSPQTARKAEPPRVVKDVLGQAQPPTVKMSPVTPGTGSLRSGGAIVIPGELRPREETEVTFEIENQTASITEIVKDIGSEVKPGDTLVKLEDIMATARLEAQRIQAKDVSESKIAAANNALDVYEKEAKRSEKLFKDGAASQADYELSVARREQARQDIIKARAEKNFEEARLREVEQQSKLFVIGSRITGTIVKVFKKKGASVRGGEPIMYIVNDKSLTVEGAFEAGFSSRLNKGMTAILEPENDREAQFIYNGHTGTVTGLALAPLNRFLASSSDDGSVILWDLQSSSTLPWARLDRADQRRIACKSLAISPAVSNDVYQVLAGYADGSVILWSFKVEGSTVTKVESKVLEKVHEQTINCIAFRGDGNYAATGSDDRRVAIWKVADGKKLYWVQAEASGQGSTHFGGVTCVLFTNDGQHLLTTGTDNTLRRWKLGASEGAELVKTAHGRTGDVRRINLANDGKYLFSEHGDELRVLNSVTLEPVSVLSSRRQGRFVSFANLSPNGQLAVTSTDQGRNLLLRLPTLVEKKVDVPGKTPGALAQTNAQTSTQLWLQDGSIGAQFTLPEAVRATCATFLTAQNQSLVLMGSTDNKIRVWQLPTEAELTTPYVAKLIFKSLQVESGTGLIRVQAEYDNSGTRKLETGKRVTMIVYPDAQDKP